MRKTLIVFSLLLYFSGCKNPDKADIPEEPVTHIKGKIYNGSDLSIGIQKINPEKFVLIDSLTLDDNPEFSINIKVEYPGFYAIKNANGDYITILCKGNDTVIVEADYYDFSQYSLKGSQELEEIAILNQKTQEFLDEISQYAKIISDSVGSRNYRTIREEIDENYRRAFEELKEFSVNFIDRNKGSLVTILALTNQLGKDFFVFHPVKDFEIFRHVDSILTEQYPASDAVKQLHSQVERLKLNLLEDNEMLSQGEIAPDFRLKDPDGKNIGLSDLTGKIIFLNFWASWCQPCQDQIPALTSIYGKYSENDFEILQVSLDKNYEDWTKSIRENEITWLNVSELNFWDSSVALMYGVQSIPGNFLIDREGKIIAVNLSPEQLNKKLDEIFN
jgi:peroxiredoxin